MTVQAFHSQMGDKGKILPAEFRHVTVARASGLKGAIPNYQWPSSRGPSQTTSGHHVARFLRRTSTSSKSATLNSTTVRLATLQWNICCKPIYTTSGMPPGQWRLHFTRKCFSCQANLQGRAAFLQRTERAAFLQRTGVSI